MVIRRPVGRRQESDSGVCVERGNLRCDVKRKPYKRRSREGGKSMRTVGADYPVGALKPGNAGRAKGMGRSLRRFWSTGLPRRNRLLFRTPDRGNAVRLWPARAVCIERCTYGSVGVAPWKAHEVQQPEMVVLVKLSQQPGTESCVVFGDGYCEA